MASPVIETKKVNKTYGSEIKNQVLYDIDLKITKGEFLALIGPSGSGKSTLLNLLGGLDRATSGEIFLSGTEISSMNDEELAKFRNENLGFIFQFHYLFPEFTAFENTSIPCLIKNKKYTSAGKDRAYELLDLVGLKGLEDRKISKLSGGQQQRVAIARALMNKPSIIFADEPTGSLDTETSKTVIDLLKKYNKENDATFVIVTHNKEIAEVTDRVVELVNGKIVR